MKQLTVIHKTVDKKKRFMRGLLYVCMVTTIVSMARHLKLTTVAEGVEDKEQLDFLELNHCDQIQGYYFARPLPGDEFLNFVKDHEGGI